MVNDQASRNEFRDCQQSEKKFSGRPERKAFKDTRNLFCIKSLRKSSVLEEDEDAKKGGQVGIVNKAAASLDPADNIRP